MSTNNQSHQYSVRQRPVRFVLLVEGLLELLVVSTHSVFIVDSKGEQKQLKVKDGRKR